MRVLFIQLTREKAPEYRNHQRHAQYAGDDVQATFFRQPATPYRPLYRSFEKENAGDVYFFEAGRNLSLRPRPSRMRRALMMGLAIPLSLPAIVSTARRVRPDVIYSSQQYLDAQLAALLSRLLGVPHVMALHYQVGPWLGRGTLGLMRGARRLIAISNYVRQTAIDHGADANAICVAHNSVEAAPFLDVADGLAVRRQLGILETAPLITSVGRLDPSKGHAELLRAFPAVVEAIPDARLLICGETFTRENYDNFLKAEVQRLGLQEHVIFAGFRHDIPAVLAASDVFCLPSYEEAFGMVFLEAMASALPVVAYRAGGVPEIVLHGETGFLAEPGDVEALSQYLLKLLGSEELARQMGSAGRERVLHHFIPAVRAPHWAQMVRRLL